MLEVVMYGAIMRLAHVARAQTEDTCQVRPPVGQPGRPQQRGNIHCLQARLLINLMNSTWVVAMERNKGDINSKKWRHFSRRQANSTAAGATTTSETIKHPN